MTNSVSSALLARTTIIKDKKNPANHALLQNGTRGNNYTSRIPVNLGANNTNAACQPQSSSTIPQATVTNTSSILRRRTSRCTSGSGSANCGKTNFKLQNPQDHTVSVIIAKNATLASQCVINPNNAYKNEKPAKSFTEPDNNGTTKQVCCVKPIVKITRIPTTSGFLKTKYFKNNCLPNPDPNSISPIKKMQNKNCGNSMGGC